MVIVFTRAYNAELTIANTIESVLNQTYRDIVYIIFDNGSEDTTFDIIKSYKEKDNRIIILQSEINMVGFKSIFQILRFISNNFCDNDWFCNIDADDTYDITFIEKMLSFCNKNNLEFAVSGYNIIDKVSGDLIESKRLPENLIIENKDLPDYFKIYRRYTTDLWAKLFKVSVIPLFLLEVEEENIHKMRTQSSLVYDALSYSSRIGFYSECLHNYYSSNTELSAQRHQGGYTGILGIGFILAKSIYQVMYDFLSSFGELSSYNTSYLYTIFWSYVTDSIKVIYYSNVISFKNKLTMLFLIFNTKLVKDALSYKADNEFINLRLENKRKFLDNMIKWIYEQPGNEQYSVKINAIMSEVNNILGAS
jgi:glycosyltransferase involved in cell wall biosynthesis